MAHAKTPDSVRDEVIRLYRLDVPYKVISAQLGIHPTTIGRIVRFSSQVQRRAKIIKAVPFVRKLVRFDLDLYQKLREECRTQEIPLSTLLKHILKDRFDGV